jgi:hypothetical protein
MIDTLDLVVQMARRNRVVVAGYIHVPGDAMEILIISMNSIAGHATEIIDLF